MKKKTKLYFIYFYDDLDNPYICSTVECVNYIIKHNYRNFFKKLEEFVDYEVQVLYL